MNRLFYPYHGLNFITRRYYTLLDYVSAGAYKTHVNLKDGWTAQANELTVNHFNDLVDWPTQLPLNSVSINELWQNYIVPKFGDEFICYSDEIDLNNLELTLQEDTLANIEKIKKVFGSFNNQFLTWLRESRTRYEKELELYKGIESNLMAQIKTTTQTKANDTPQIPDTDLETDPYVSNIATTEQLSDVGTPIERLKQVRNNIRNTYETWADEFRKFVMYA